MKSTFKLLVKGKREIKKIKMHKPTHIPTQAISIARLYGVTVQHTIRYGYVGVGRTINGIEYGVYVSKGKSVYIVSRKSGTTLWYADSVMTVCKS